MNRTLRIIVLIILAFFPSSLNGQNIFRFDHIGSEDGLSLNTGFSILFDSKGFMWVGTYNGLNRYDGYEFKIFRSSSGNPSSFTNNRVIKLWEDKRGFIWRETYDGYYHFFNPVTEVFHSIPLYEGSDVHNGAMKFFLQYSTDIIFLGSSESATFGLNLLEKKDIESGNYRFKVFLKNPADDKSLIYNDVIHIFEDSKKRIWLGTFGGVLTSLKGIMGRALLSGIMALKPQSVMELFTGYSRTVRAKYGSALRMVLYASIRKQEIQRSLTMLMAWGLTAFQQRGNDRTEGFPLKKKHFIFRLTDAEIFSVEFQH
jgi:ligand-binding sensor domain-containing protein